MLLVFAERVSWDDERNALSRRSARCPEKEELAPLLLVPPDETKGHPRTVDFRDVVNDILYVLREAQRWPPTLHDLPPWCTVWWYFGIG